MPQQINYDDIEEQFKKALTANNSTHDRAGDIAKNCVAQLQAMERNYPYMLVPYLSQSSNLSVLTSSIVESTQGKPNENFSEVGHFVAPIVEKSTSWDQYKHELNETTKYLKMQFTNALSSKPGVGITDDKLPGIVDHIMKEAQKNPEVFGNLVNNMRSKADITENIKPLLESNTTPENLRENFFNTILSHNAEAEELPSEHPVLRGDVPLHEVQDTSVVVCANLKTEESIVSDTMHDYSGENTELNSAVNKAIETSSKNGALQKLEPMPGDNANTTIYEHGGTRLTQIEGSDGKISFKPDKSFTGIVTVQRKDKDGKLLADQKDVIEYKDGKPIAVCMATKGTCRVANISGLQHRAVGGLNVERLAPDGAEKTSVSAPPPRGKTYSSPNSRSP
jgi:hypothetical protein